jgi:RNA polymerase sigma-70 factor (ECF subfamily)
LSEATPSDAHLVTLAREGRRNGFESLVHRHLPALVGFFRYLRAPPSLIDDLVQETFAKTFRNLDLYDPNRSFITWLLSIARNLFYDQCRRSAHDPVLPGELQATGTMRVEEEVIQRLSLQDLLARLPEESRFLVELRIFQDLPFAEIAKVTNESEGALRVRFHRILQQLRQRAGKEGAV